MQITFTFAGVRQYKKSLVEYSKSKEWQKNRPLSPWQTMQSRLRCGPWCWGHSRHGDTSRWSVAWCGCSSGSKRCGFGCGLGRGSPGNAALHPWSLYRTDPWSKRVRRMQTCVIPWRLLRLLRVGCVSSPVQSLVQSLVGWLVTLDSLHEVFNGLLCVAVYVVRTAQLHLLQGEETQGEDVSRERGNQLSHTAFTSHFVKRGRIHLSNISSVSRVILHPSFMHKCCIFFASCVFNHLSPKRISIAYTQ